jgi:hypothetical protein
MPIATRSVSVAVLISTAFAGALELEFKGTGDVFFISLIWPALKETVNASARTKAAVRIRRNMRNLLNRIFEELRSYPGGLALWPLARSSIKTQCVP